MILFLSESCSTERLIVFLFCFVLNKNYPPQSLLLVTSTPSCLSCVVLLYILLVSVSCVDHVTFIVMHFKIQVITACFGRIYEVNVTQSFRVATIF